jgi:hypothetical protein
MIKPIVLEGCGRAELYKMFAERGYKVGCEVGVREGRNAWVMMQHIPGLKLYLVDPYRAYEYVNKRKRNRWKWHQPDMDRMRFKALRRLAQNDIVWFMLPSLEAVKYVEDGSLDFVYIDGDHRFEAVMQDILAWEPKVRKGGALSGHDYNIRSIRPVVQLFAGRTRLPLYVTDKAKEREGSRNLISWVFFKE